MNKQLKTIVIMLIATAPAGLMSCKKGDNVTPTITNDTTAVQPVSDNERASLIHMREEEKLAHDVYTLMLDKWGLNIYANISNSEQKHMDAVLGLLNTYKIADPVGNNGAGVFTDTSIQNLYNDLIAKGSLSLVDALEVGAMIEDMDLHDLKAARANITHADITTVYDNLAKGSRNHMREFYSQLSSRGVTYQPQFITKEELNAIITTPKEMGN